ncbi:hypothetical protein ACPUEX_22355 [Enterobacter vonholyi]
MRYNLIKSEIKRALNEDSLYELKKLLDLGFLYINEDRDYIAIDINSDEYTEDSFGQTFIFTAEGDDECEELWFNNDYKAWDGEFGYSYGYDLNGALIKAQEVALRVFDKYQ